LNKGIRGLISDYALAISVIVFTVLNRIRTFKDVGVETLPVPQSFAPSNGRELWMIDPFLIPTWAIFLAIIPGFVLTVLFFFDHNVSSLLAQQPHYNLQKPAAYNLDFLIIGIMIFICGLLGIPFTNGLIPQAPLHVRALSKIKDVALEDPHHPGRFVKREHFEYVVEQRLSNFAHALLIGVMAIVPVFLDLLRTIPVSVLDGLFLFMGVSSFAGNHFAERFLVSFLVFDHRSRLHAAPHSWPDIEMQKILFSKVVKFTVIQVAFLGIIVGVTYSSISITFPLVILIMIPTRIWLLTWKGLGSWRFDENELAALDGESSPIDIAKDDGLPVPEFELAEYERKDAENAEISANDGDNVELVAY
jgi:hypothetical protein